MAKDKGVKTNAMRILDKKKISYKVNYYECDEFIDGIPYEEIVEIAREYIRKCGGFERFAEWGLV